MTVRRIVSAAVSPNSVLFRSVPCMPRAGEINAFGVMAVRARTYWPTLWQTTRAALSVVGDNHTERPIIATASISLGIRAPQP
jgi:hypothetical protein